MIDSDFQAAMSENELLAGEKCQKEIEQSRKLAMAAGLTRSSKQLRDTWEADPETYEILLKGAVAAYEQNVLIEELLRGSIARLASVAEEDTISAQLMVKISEIALSNARN